MKKQIIGTGAIALFICIVLSGCEGSQLFWTDEEKFIGIWTTEQVFPEYLPPQHYVNYSEGYEFDQSGKVRNHYGLNGTWEIKDGKLIIIYDDPYINGTYIYEYHFLNSHKMTLLKIPSDNRSSVIYKRT